MDKAKHLSKEEQKNLLDYLAKLADSRNYVSRSMSLEVNSDYQEDNTVMVKGNLCIRATENPKDDDAWKEAKFSVAMFDDIDKLGVTVVKVVSNLYSIPDEYGDSIFEDGFYSFLSGESEETIN